MRILTALAETPVYVETKKEKRSLRARALSSKLSRMRRANRTVAKIFELAESLNSGDLSPTQFRRRVRRLIPS